MATSNTGALDPAALIDDARKIAHDIRSGTLGLYEGGRRIWWECHLYLPPDDHKLDPFTYWASEYEEAEDDERKALCETGLRAAVEALLDEGDAL